MRRLRPLIALLALAALPGCVVNDGRGLDHGYGYPQPRSYYAPAPRYYAPAPSYYAPAPRYSAPAPRWHNPPPSHWDRNSHWREHRRAERHENRREERRERPQRPEQQRFFMFDRPR